MQKGNDSRKRARAVRHQAAPGSVKRISSRWTRYHKTVFPLVWFGFLAAFVAMSLLQGVDGEMGPIFILGPLAMMAFGYFLFRKLFWSLVDEVYDCGDSILVRNKGREERISLSNVINVSESSLTNPPRIELRLDKPGRFGNEIAFSPEVPWGINPFARSKVGEDLIVRVDQARRKRAT